ncbi:MAG: TonB-dependent receptor [Acidobacteria bacterium]|nr:TonB-dependent receptor [Acidobacteriota bacterium]
MLLALSVWVAVAQGPVPAATPAAVQAAPCRIVGTVVDSLSLAGVGGALVTLRTQGASTRATADSALDGRFAFSSIAPGIYSITASTAGFSESAPVTVAPSGDPCQAAVEIPYRLAMQTEARPDASQPATATIIPGPVARVLTGEAIAATPGALDDMFRAMQAQPGVAASQDNRNDLLVRGGGAIENQTLIDGFDVPNPNHFGAQGGSGGALSIIPPWLVQSGTFDVSGFSAAYGDRMSSVVHIGLRPGRADRVHTMLGAGVGGAMAIAEGPMGGTGSWLVSARRSLLEAAFREKNAEAVPTYSDALVKFDRRFGDRHAVTFLGIGTKDGVSIQDEATGANDLTGDEWIGMAGLRVDSQWSARTATSLSASIGTSEVDARAYDGTTVDAIDRGRDVDFRVRADMRRAGTPVGDILVGAAVKAYHYDYDLYVNDIWTPYEPVKRDLESSDRRSFADAAAYLEMARQFFAGRVRLLAGIRADHWSAASVTAASPRVKVEYAARRRIRVSGFWGTYRQSVPYIWMASAPENVSLPPIQSSQFGGGVDVDVRRWLRVGVEGFDKSYRNYPVDPVAPGRVLVSTAAEFDSPFVGPLVSGGQVHGSGIDSVAVLTPASRLQVTTNYSYWDVSQLGLDGVWRRAEHERRHQARVEMAWQPARHWNTGFRWRYVSGHPYTPFDTKASIKAGRGVYDLSRINTLDYPPYRRLDVRVDRTFVKGRTSTMLFIEAENVLDHDNVLVYEWSRSLRGPKTLYQWGRTFVGGIRVEF